MRSSVMIMIVALLGGMACTDAGETAESAPTVTTKAGGTIVEETTTSSSAAPLTLGTEAQRSIEGIPIPLEATWVPGLLDKKPDDPTTRSYHLPRGVTLEQAHRWFTARIPHGRALNSKWSWCDYPELEFGSYQWIWGRVGDAVTDSLTLSLGREDSSNAKPEERGIVYFLVHIFEDDDPVHC